MGEKHKIFRESRTPFPLRDIRKNPHNIYAREPQAMAQFVLKIEKLSHIMGPTPVLEMARAYGLRPRLWLQIIIMICFSIKLETEWFDFFSRMLSVKVLCKECHVIADELNRMC